MSYRLWIRKRQVVFNLLLTSLFPPVLLHRFPQVGHWLPHVLYK